MQRILVVEHDDLRREQLFYALSGTGYTVACAKGSMLAEAALRVSAWPFVVIVDLCGTANAANRILLERANRLPPHAYVALVPATGVDSAARIPAGQAYTVLAHWPVRSVAISLVDDDPSEEDRRQRGSRAIAGVLAPLAAVIDDEAARLHSKESTSCPRARCIFGGVC